MRGSSARVTDRDGHLCTLARDRFSLCVIAALALLILGCARRPLPENGTADEQLYAQRCGTCHRAYQPSTLSTAMWQLQVDAMELKIRAAGMPPLTVADKQAILEYLERHASQSQ